MTVAVARIRERTAEELRELADQGARALEGASAEEIIDWAVESFPGSLLVSQSMACAVLAHLVGRRAIDVPLVFLDTGLHFPETLAARDEVSQRIPLPLINLEPDQSVAEQAIAHGAELWHTSPDRCCALRKVAPMERLLQGYEAWMTGIRFSTSEHRRGQVKAIGFDEARGVVKIAPLLEWTDDDVLAYAMRHDVPVNRLVFEGYPSIGCAPCTKAVPTGEDARSGRWEGRAKTECGLHR